MLNVKKSISAAGLVLVAAVALTGCSVGKATEPFKDAPRGAVNRSPADTIEMPDGFNNAATKCDHGNRIYTTYHGNSPYGGIAVVPNDPTCAK